VQRLALGRGEQPAAGPQAVQRAVVTHDVFVDPDTAVGQGVIEGSQGGGDPVQRPPERVGQPARPISVARCPLAVDAARVASAASRPARSRDPRPGPYR
jgi:hypothetical protein